MSKSRDRSSSLGKRCRLSDVLEPSTPPCSFPTFLILHSGGERPFGQISPFFVEKALKGITYGIKQVKKLKSGDLLVETTGQQASQALLKAKALGTIPMVVSPHASLNTCRGVISDPCFLDLNDEELLDGLSTQGVSAIRRIHFRKDGKTQPTKTIILTFSLKELPSTIHVGYMNIRVRPYIPNPLRCFKCQRYGHGSNACRGQATCPKCGKLSHGEEPCSADLCCINCNGNHPAFSRSCPKWKLEKEIQTIRVKQNLSYPEAKKQIMPFHQAKSYAAAVKPKSSISVATQTNISCPPQDTFTITLAGVSTLPVAPPSAARPVHPTASTSAARPLPPVPSTSSARPVPPVAQKPGPIPKTPSSPSNTRRRPATKPTSGTTASPSVISKGAGNTSAKQPPKIIRTLTTNNNQETEEADMQVELNPA